MTENERNKGGRPNGSNGGLFTKEMTRKAKRQLKEAQDNYETWAIKFILDNSL